MHPYFVRQKINYGIYLIEPDEKIEFNRGLLMNIGFIESIRDRINLKNISIEESMKNNNTYWNCWIFHDVDMIPEDERLIYGCSDESPMHFAVSVSKFYYKTTDYFSNYYGGIVSFTKDQYLNINGFSNLYFGWGGEDDDLKSRVVLKYKDFKKIPANIGVIYTHDHDLDVPNPQRHIILEKILQTVNITRNFEDGIKTLKYKVVNISKNDLFTKIVVNYKKDDYNFNKFIL
ncbi:unnamed protein product [Brachionus calyciflorus]|uniref:Uncharacterized protein n=1 Tax=Brachionus calyciflorus TaxID=104777 RepID=A0A813M4I9_9BILA|nr:unnamed protein product [Brachionus calyciflorus]